MLKQTIKSSGSPRVFGVEEPDNEETAGSHIET